MEWWPPLPEHGMLGYVAVIHAFFCWAVPIMFIIDWCALSGVPRGQKANAIYRFNRTSVESRTEQTLRRPDMIDIPRYYSRSPASCFALLQWNDKIIGLVAVDSSNNSVNDEPLEKGVRLDAQQERDLVYGKGTSKVATIRHFFSEEGYRSAGIDVDLLRYALQRAFSDETVQTVRISVSSLKRNLSNQLQKHNFVEGESDGKLGPFGWRWRWHTLSRTKWAADVAAKEVR